MKGGPNGLEEYDGVLDAFDYVDINEGNGFNGATGIFRAPVAGTYAFTFNGVTSDKLGRTFVQVLKDGKIHHDIIDANEADGNNNIGDSWMFKLRRGEEVNLEVDIGKLYTHYYSYIYFTGQLLKADE